MKPNKILTKNHDTHMHSRNFSDGKHSAQEVVRFCARWQKTPRWVGISDHSPATNKKLKEYTQKLHPIQEELYKMDKINLLVSLELEWDATAPACSELRLDALDYVIAAYHGRKFSETSQAESYFSHATCHPYTDIIGHPDRFLGSVDTIAIHWEKIFNKMFHRGVLCEYNLTTPLNPAILAIAIKHTEVKFVIGSDTHDFRNIAVRRVIDAWSEYLGGGYALARAYLNNLLKLNCPPEKTKRIAGLFETEQLLDNLQQRLYQHSLTYRAESIYLSPEEDLLIQVLESIPECEVDKDFLTQRLDRFSCLPNERIVSCLDKGRFKEVIKEGRKKRIR